MMSSVFEDSVVDFDLSPFQPSSNNAVVSIDRVRKAISITKRKIMVNDSFIKKYSGACLSNRTLEKSLASLKEEYKQACIESMEYREKCLALEKEIKNLHLTNKELELKYVTAHNQHDGMQSHAKQLEQLVKENETLIESLKIEHQLEKANSKEIEILNANLQKENVHLMKNMSCVRDIVFGRKKLTKELKSFLLTCFKKSGDDAFDAEEISGEVDTYDDLLPPSVQHSSPDFEVRNDKLVLTLPIENVRENKDTSGSELRSFDINEGNTYTRDDNDHDDDDGRGSSLAFSDSDKCFNSPEYFTNHSPLNAEVLRSRDKPTVNVSTSPFPVKEVINVATSPIIFENLHILDGIEKNVSNEIKPKGCDNNKTTMIDRVLSPIFATHCVEVSTSPITNSTNNAATFPLNQDMKTSNCYNQQGDQNTQEKDLMEINNSSCIEDDNSNDCEVQMIFNSMRFSEKLITPIPTTPAKSRNVEALTNAATQTKHASVCPDAAKLREENIPLYATLAELVSDVKNIKEYIFRDIGTKGPQIISGDHTVEREIQNQVLAQNIRPAVKISDAIYNNAVHFEDKILKLKKLNRLLFADSSSPSPCDADMPSPSSPPSPFPSSLCNAAPPSPSSPSPCDALAPSRFAPSSSDVAPPLPSSPSSPSRRDVAPPSPSPRDVAPPSPSSPSPRDAVLLSPPPPLHTLEKNDVDNSNIIQEEDIRPTTKERLQFEDPISNRGLVTDRASSDYEVYENEYVIELSPDTLESDTKSLLEMLKKQDSIQENINGGQVQNKKTPKIKKNTIIEKLRKTMLPKSKIKNDIVQAKTRKRIRPKRLNTNGDRILNSQISHNAAYEKACKIMSELRLKEKVQKNDDNLIVVLPKLSISPEKGARKTNKCVNDVLMTDLFNRNENLQESCIKKQNQGIAQNDLSKVTSNIKLTPQKPIYEISDVTQISKKNVKNNKTTPEIASILENSQVTENKSGLPGRRIIRTRSQSKSMSHDEPMTQKPENRSDSLHPLSPKIYGKNRRKSKVEESLIHNNDIIVCGLIKSNIVTVTEESNDNSNDKRMSCRKTLKRQSVDKSDLASKRMLRSYAVLNDSTDPRSKRGDEKNEDSMFSRTTKEMVTYGDMDIFEDTEKNTNELVVPRAKNDTPKFGILCNVLDRYGRKSSKIPGAKLPENAINNAYKKIEDGIAEMQKISYSDCKVAMDKLVKNLQGLKPKQTLAGIMKFLKEPARKIELFNKLNAPMAPPLTKAEQILIYIVSQLKVNWPDIVENILSSIEYSLFMLNRTPEFDVIETLAHFYAVLCRYDDKRDRLRRFIMNAMYCLQYKAVPLIKQCMEVDMKILPLAHMAMAKSPLVMCLVYLLHFYKCEDKFNRVQEIRNILHRKYFYEVSEWNEPRILEMFRNSIVELSDVADEKTMLRTAFIILAKRNGARWCQNNIIQNMLLPIIEQPQVPDRIKQFCVSLLGALLKPYPIDMRVNCEIVMNQLFSMLSRNPSDQMVEAIFTSLIHMSRHNQNRVIKALLFWKPDRISPELEELLKNYVKERPLKSWRTVISKFTIQQV